MPRIAVFAGHGGTDPGAVANGHYEKNINLALSNEVTRILRSRGYEVVNNRTTDVNRDINADVALANRSNVDGVVEIHMNSNMGAPGSGTEAYYSIRGGRSKDLAQALVNGLVALGFYDRGVKTRINAAGNDYFGIIRDTNAPAALLEVAFINNPADMARLNIYTASQAIANAIMQTFPISVTPPPPVTGDPVMRDIQSTLNQRYGTGLTVDGVFGRQTKAAIVTGLQSELNRQFGRNLAVDGIWGPATRAATVTVRQGAAGNITYLIQAALYARGYSLRPDGVFGPATEAAVRAFQRDQGLTVDGIVSAAVQDRLFR